MKEERVITGRVRSNRRTKRLVTDLKEGEMAVIFHRDLDAIAARSLAGCRPCAVINLEESMSGRYVNGGPRVLLNAGIPLFDAQTSDWVEGLMDGDELTVRGATLFQGDKPLTPLIHVTDEVLEERSVLARGNLESQLTAFASNTLRYLVDERSLLFNPPAIPELKTKLAGRPALVVVRGEGYLEDLQMVRAYIEEQQPVLIGVDGGADAILEAGFPLDILIGDMDSASDTAVSKAREIVVHAYADGRAPGLERVESAGRTAVVFPVPGTSEDAAILMAYERGATLIVAVGTHFSLEEFLDKGREGMASTFLVRLRVGKRLVDAKGVSRLYKGGLRTRHIVTILLASAIPIAVVLAISSPLRDMLSLFGVKLQFWLWQLRH